MPPSSMKRLASPLLGALNTKLASLFQHVTTEANAVRGSVSYEGEAVRAAVRAESEETRRVAAEVVDAAMQTVAEASTFLTHTSVRLEQRLVALTEVTAGARLLAEAADDPVLVSALLGALRTQPIGAAPDHALEFVNWVTGHLGWYSQTGSWLNTGAYIELSAGSASVRSVNERTVEVPYALGVAAGLAPGSPVLDLGAVESLLSLQLASLGHPTTALDTRRYPFEHPNLTVVTSPVEAWDGPAEPLAAAFCISTVEHLGLDPYGGTPRLDDGDIAALTRLRGWLRDDGLLVLTVPFGRPSVDDFQRVYDEPGLARLLEGWEVVDRRTAVRRSATAWVVDEAAGGPKRWSGSVEGVALVTARPAG